MKVRNLAFLLAFVVAAWLPILAQQSATSSQEPAKPVAAEPAKDEGKFCANCCKAHEAADKSAAEHKGGCCAAKDGKGLECCQAKEGKQATCCDKGKEVTSAMDCCKGHDMAAKNDTHDRRASAGKDGKACCGKDAMACNSKDKKGCCAGMKEQCPAHASGR